MRVEAPPLADCPWYLRPFFLRQRRKYGAPLTAALVWARVPRLYFAVVTLYRLIDSRFSPLERTLRALVMVRISQVNGCRFCTDLNSATILELGLGEDKLMATADWRHSPLFDDRERAALAYAEAVSLAANRIPEEVHAALRRHFDEQTIVELTALIAFQNMSSKFNSALDIPPQGICRIPPPEGSP